MLTLKAALEEAVASVGRVDAQVILAHLLGVDRAYLVANPMRVLTESEDARVDMLVAQRQMGHPVAYLIGKREFYGRDFMVGPDVLIPRPETETLVEAALQRLVAPDAANAAMVAPDAASAAMVAPDAANAAMVAPDAASAAMVRGPICVLDLGTGSGAIAVTLACERPDVAMTATDASAQALAVARANASAHGCESRIAFLQGSWYGPVQGRRFDLIVANPPYVARGDPHLAQGDLRFEPPGALTDGSRDGLDSIRAIVAGAGQHLNPGGWLLLEHGYDQQAAVAGLLAAAGFEDPVSIADLAGIARVAGGKIA